MHEYEANFDTQNNSSHEWVEKISKGRWWMEIYSQTRSHLQHKLHAVVYRAKRDRKKKKAMNVAHCMALA